MLESSRSHHAGSTGIWTSLSTSERRSSGAAFAPTTGNSSQVIQTRRIEPGNLHRETSIGKLESKFGIQSIAEQRVNSTGSDGDLALNRFPTSASGESRPLRSFSPRQHRQRPERPMKTITAAISIFVCFLVCDSRLQAENFIGRPIHALRSPLDGFNYSIPGVWDWRRNADETHGETEADIPDINEKGWVALFNGVDLDGWVQKNGTATYRVEQSMIVGKTSEGSPNSFLCTVEDYGDFELTFEVFDDPGLNSGVQIRSKSRAEFNNGRVYGPQVEIENAPGESGYLYSEGTGRGWITPEQPIKDAYINGQWNRYVVRAKGDRIQTWVNGRLIVDTNDPESAKRGFIGLQVHSIPRETGPFEVRWRDIRIREL